MAKMTGPFPSPTVISLTDLGKYGVIQDMPPHLLPPEAWSNGKNVRFSKRGVRRMEGHIQTLGTLSIVPEFIFNVKGAQGSLWIYTSLTKAYVEDAGTHTNITRHPSASDVNYTVGSGAAWQGTFIGGVPILNNGADVPQYWPTLSSATRLADLANWDSGSRCKVMRGFGPYLVAMNVTDGATISPHLLRWSAKADPGFVPASWDVTDPTVDAGQTELTDIKGGQILDGVLLGQYLIIYKESAMHIMRLAGDGANLFAFDILAATSGILATRCASAFNKGTQHFVVTEDDVITHDGTKSNINSVIEDRNRKFLFSDIDGTNYANAFTFDNVKQKEMWFCYPSSGETYPNMAAIWNYKDDCWTFRDIAQAVWADSGSLSTAASPIWNSASGAWDNFSGPWGAESRNDLLLLTRSTTGAFKLDSGYAFGALTPTAFVERTGLAIDGVDRNKKPIVDFNSRKLLSRLWPKINSATPVQIKTGSQETRDAPIVWSTPQTFDPTTQLYLDVTENGRLLAYHIEWAANASVEIEGMDFEISKTSNL